MRLILILLATLTPSVAHAQPQTTSDNLPYTVTLPPTGEAALDTALHDSSSLIGLNGAAKTEKPSLFSIAGITGLFKSDPDAGRTAAPVGPFALVTRAREDRTRLQAALGSFGHYDGKVAITIAGRDIDDPALPDILDAASRTTPIPVAITVTPGPTYTIRNLTLRGPNAEQARPALKPLQPGDPARAADVLSAGGRMLDSLRNDGHALATVSPPDAAIAPPDKAMDVAWQVTPGPRVNLGPITVDGLDRVDESYVRRRLTIHEGDPFDPRTIEAARQDLASVGVFATVRAKAAERLDPSGRLPIEIDVTERPRHAVGFNASYSTDLGASAGVTWQHRNLFGQAEQLNLGAAVTQLGGSASRRPGYNVTASLTKPDVFSRDQSVTVSLQGIKESLDAYDRTALLAGIQVNRKLTKAITATAGVQAQQSRIAQEGITRDYTLIGLPLGLKYDDTGPAGLFEPTSGVKAALAVTPTASLKDGTNFTVVQLSGSTYLDLGNLFAGTEGRSVLALRAILGTIQGGTTFQVPPDQRFYAGGSGTVRGYKYQSVGPRFADNRPTGGTSLGAVTVEYRQRFGESFGAAVFVDAGQVDTRSTPFGGQLRAGAGVGARYYTPIGPIRLDVALPLNKQASDDAFELYIGLGQAF